MAASKIEFFVTNKDRLAYELPLDWRVEFHSLIQELGADSFTLQVDGAYFTNFIPNIMKGVNDKIRYDLTDISGTITSWDDTIAAGQYDITSMANTLTALLVNRSGNIIYTVVYDAVQMKFNITVPYGCQITIIRPNYAETFRYNNAYDRFLEVIGWSSPDAKQSLTGITSPSSTFSPNNLVRLNGTSYVHICMEGNHSSYTTSKKGNRPIACYPVDAQYGGLCFSGNTLENAFTVDASVIQSGIRFYIVDEWGTNIAPYVPSNMLFHFRFSLLPIG